jgi:hypothetical protein
MRNRKWQGKPSTMAIYFELDKPTNQACWQFILNWTNQQTDPYLAIPEVAMECNVEPG